MESLKGTAEGSVDFGCGFLPPRLTAELTLKKMASAVAKKQADVDRQADKAAERAEKERRAQVKKITKERRALAKKKSSPKGSCAALV